MMTELPKDMVEAWHKDVRICAVYAGKGGVGKTTTTYNLAHALAAQGHRVVMVDADSQCSLSRMCLPELFDADIATGIPGGHLAGRQVPASLLDALTLYIDGVVPAMRASKLPGIPVCKPVPAHCYPLNADGSVQLLHGSFQLEEVFASRLEASITPTSGEAVRTFAAFQRVLWATAAFCNSTIVLVDMSPSSGILNRHIIMTSTHFLMPVAADALSLEAARLIKVRMLGAADSYSSRGWIKWAWFNLYMMLRDWYGYKVHGPPVVKYIGMIITDITGEDTDRRWSALLDAASTDLANALSHVPYESQGRDRDAVHALCKRDSIVLPGDLTSTTCFSSPTPDDQTWVIARTDKHTADWAKIARQVYARF